jgi:SAM-dependent methyltransferase
MNVYIVAASDAEADPERRKRWGDYWFKESLGQAIKALGHSITENALEAEVVINCHGAAVQHLPEWTYNILWVIGHPDAVTPQGCWEYDAVFAESYKFAEHLRGQGIDAKHLPGASDMVPMDVEQTFDAIFVGNWRPGRTLDVPEDMELNVWGEGWREHLKRPNSTYGEYYPHDHLNELYAKARVLPNDTHADMQKWGMNNPRHYDILAVRGEQVPTFAECAAVLMDAVPTERVMLDLGCGEKPRPGMIGVDKRGGARVAEEDLESGLPFFVRPKRSHVIVADNLLEHIKNLIPLLNDCHQALLPNGRMHIRVPNAERGATVAWADPTHVRAWVPDTFDYFNADHQRWQQYGQGYGIRPWHIVYCRAYPPGHPLERFIDVLMRPAVSDG